MSSESDSGIEKIVQAVIIGLLFAWIMNLFLKLAYVILPKNEDGTVNPVLQAFVGLSLAGLTLVIISAAIEPPYHPIVDAKPDTVKSLMYRKCILHVKDDIPLDSPNSDGAPVDLFCVALNSPDLPSDLQNLVVPKYDRFNPYNELSRRHIKFTQSYSTLGQLRTSNPDQFSGPVWMWADGTRPRTNKYWFFNEII